MNVPLYYLNGFGPYVMCGGQADLSSGRCSRCFAPVDSSGFCGRMVRVTVTEAPRGREEQK